MLNFKFHASNFHSPPPNSLRKSKKLLEKSGFYSFPMILLLSYYNVLVNILGESNFEVWNYSFM